MRIVQIVHGLPPDATGGTELYVDALSQTLASMGHDVLVVAREENPRRRELAIARERRGRVEVARLNNTFAAVGSFEESYRNPRIGVTVAHLVEEFAPDAAHVHHLTCLSTDIPGRLVQAGVPVVFTLHDYWLICHRGQLLDREYRICGGPEDGGCAGCLGAAGGAGRRAYLAARALRPLSRIAPKLGPAVQAVARNVLPGASGGARALRESLKRLDHLRQVASAIPLFLAPSDYIRDRFIAFGVPPDRIVRHEQGIDTAAFACRLSASGPLRIGYFGALVPSKGAHVLLEAFRTLPRGSAQLRVYGNIAAYHDDRGPDERVRALLRVPGVEHAGGIPRARIPEALRALDVVVVPSIWPENAPFIIREAIASRVPVVASRIGGIPEAVRDGENGLLFAANDAADCARALRQFLEDRALVDRLAPVAEIRSLAEDAALTLGFYRRVAAAERRTMQAPARAVAGRLAAVVLNFHTPDDTVVAVRSLQASTRPPDEILVIDNESADCGAALRARIRGARILHTRENPGFAGGVNAGIREAMAGGADLVLLLNPDVVVPPGTTSALEQALVDYPDAGIAGPALLARSEPDLVASLGMRFSEPTGRMTHAGFGRRLDTFGMPRRQPVDGVSGCAMLVRREVFERVGLFDESYFFGFEDLDFCLRARETGFATLCCADTIAYHEGGGAIGRRSPRRVYFAARNHLKLAAAHPGASGRIRRLGAVIAFNAAYVLRSPDVPLFSGLVAFGRGVRDHFAGRYGRD